MHVIKKSFLLTELRSKVDSITGSYYRGPGFKFESADWLEYLCLRRILLSCNEDIKTDHQLDQRSKHSYALRIYYLSILCHLVSVVVSPIIPQNNKTHSHRQSS
jgi:hypothetical protein